MSLEGAQQRRTGSSSASGYGAGGEGLLPRLLHLGQRFSERGQDFAEYGLLMALITLIVIAAVTITGVQLGAIWERISAGLLAALP